MPLNHKALRQRMKQERDEKQEKIKSLIFSLPDLHGPEGNAFALLAQADALMKRNDIPEYDRTVFNKEATSGDYEHLLGTIEKWFTVAVPVTEYVALGERSIRDVFPKTVDPEDPDEEQPETKEEDADA